MNTDTDAGARIGVSSFAVVEIVYAAEKPRNPLTSEDADAILAVLRSEESPSCRALERLPLLVMGASTSRRSGMLAR